MRNASMRLCLLPHLDMSCGLEVTGREREGAMRMQLSGANAHSLDISLACFGFTLSSLLQCLLRAHFPATLRYCLVVVHLYLRCTSDQISTHRSPPYRSASSSEAFPSGSLVIRKICNAASSAFTPGLTHIHLPWDIPGFLRLYIERSIFSSKELTFGTCPIMKSLLLAIIVHSSLD
jgi:hypothetical protein